MANCMRLMGGQVTILSTVSDREMSPPIWLKLFVANARFDRVILAPIAVGGSTMEEWATGVLAKRIPVTLRRLDDLGITRKTRGVSFALEWGQGPSENATKTSKADYIKGFRK